METVIKKVKKDDKYAQISNDIINDRNLSFKALGIITYVLSKPNDWTVYISDLMRDGVEGEKSVRSGLNELIENKYVQRYRVYDMDTKKVNHWETLVSEVPFQDDDLISIVKEKYLKDSDGNIVMKKETNGKITREIPIVLEREVELLSQKGKVGEKKLLSQNVQVGLLEVGKEGLQILIPTKTDSNQNLNCSCSSDPIKMFEDSICELKKTTKVKFLEICNNCNADLIKSILDYSADINIKSYAGFEKIIKAALSNNIITGSEFNKSVEEFRAAKKNKPRSNSKAKNKDLKFNNFEGRSYDFNALEDFLLHGGYDGEDLPL